MIDPDGGFGFFLLLWERHLAEIIVARSHSHSLATYASSTF